MNTIRSLLALMVIVIQTTGVMAGPPMTAGWLHHSVTVDKCVTLGREVLMTLGYAITGQTIFSIFGETDSYTAYVNCEIPSYAFFMIVSSASSPQQDFELLRSALRAKLQ